MELAASILSDKKAYIKICKICKKKIPYTNLSNLKRLKNKPCRSCANSISMGGSGLLCCSCNSAIGLLKDDISLLENAIQYLKGAN